MEVIDIGLSDLEPITFDLNDQNNNNSNSSNSVSFGPGIELLMNDKQISSNKSSRVDMGDLDKLENELNELSTNTNNDNSKSLGGFSNMFNFGSSTETVKEVPLQTDSNIGSATVDSIGSTKTMDGYGKMNDIPTFNSSGPGSSSSSRMSERDKRRKKRAMIKKLEEWYDKGLIKHNSNFNLESDYDEVEDEYETAMDDKRKKDSVKLQGWWFTTLINSMEYANAVFDPFGLNLDGWGEQINEDIDSYEEIFGELHEKYKGGKMSPEVSLLLRVGFSGAVLNITNKALSTATPGYPDEKVNTSYGVPPPPMKTSEHPPPTRPGMQYTQSQNNRPDISMGRGTMFREDGVDMNQQYENLSMGSKMPNQNSEQRPEMKGPQSIDLDNLLSGLKTREVNLGDRSNDDNTSMVSVSSLTDGQNSALPKRTNRRKQRSDKNMISLDI